jgi:hypothetical protein
MRIGEPLFSEINQTGLAIYYCMQFFSSGSSTSLSLKRDLGYIDITLLTEGVGYVQSKRQG